MNPYEGVFGGSKPVQTGFRFVEYLNEHPDATYDDLSANAGVTKTRVCQMIALCKRLPSEITDYLMNTDDPETLNFLQNGGSDL